MSMSGTNAQGRGPSPSRCAICLPRRGVLAPCTFSLSSSGLPRSLSPKSHPGSFHRSLPWADSCCLLLGWPPGPTCSLRRAHTVLVVSASQTGWGGTATSPCWALSHFEVRNSLHVPSGCYLEGPESSRGTLVGKIFPTERLMTGCGLGKNDISGSLSSLNKHHCDRDKAKGTNLTELWRSQNMVRAITSWLVLECWGQGEEIWNLGGATLDLYVLWLERYLGSSFCFGVVLTVDSSGLCAWTLPWGRSRRVWVLWQSHAACVTDVLLWPTALPSEQWACWPVPGRSLKRQKALAFQVSGWSCACVCWGGDTVSTAAMCHPAYFGG